MYFGVAGLILTLFLRGTFAKCGNDFDKFLLVDAHNKARQKRGARDLTWSIQISNRAQKYAKGCPDKHSTDVQRNYMGENMWTAWGSYAETSTPCNAAVIEWLKEEYYYDYKRPGNVKAGASGGIGHFTQTVWNSSREVGCGVAWCPAPGWGRKLVVVCQYSPSGNWGNQYDENVFAPDTGPPMEDDKEEQDQKVTLWGSSTNTQGKKGRMKNGRGIVHKAKGSKTKTKTRTTRNRRLMKASLSTE